MAIAIQIAVALIQAEAYANLEDLTQPTIRSLRPQTFQLRSHYKEILIDHKNTDFNNKITLHSR